MPLNQTPDHRFYSNGEWIEVGKLQVGDTLQQKNGVYTFICGIEKLPQIVKVYNFDVEGNQNYYVTEDGILVHNGLLCAGTPEHKKIRWEEYQARGGEWDYKRWSNVYTANMTKAKKAHKACDDYNDQIGWGKREVTIDVKLGKETVKRRLDIADPSLMKGVEIKSGKYFSRSEDIMSEIARDKELVKNGWDID